MGSTISGSMPGSSAAVGMSDGARNVRYFKHRDVPGLEGRLEINRKAVEH